MIKIAVCDDENLIINQIETIIFDTGNREGIDVNINAFYCGESLEKAILTGERYDLIYLDIQMKENNGVETAKNIRKMDENVLLIFVSGYEKYMIELFSLEVFAFIRKPIQLQSFAETFLNAKRKISSKNFYFVYQYKNKEYKLKCNDILYFESDGRKIRINLRNGDVEVFNGKISEVEAKLSKGKIFFLRIHQSYYVNYNLIKSRSKTEVTMINGMTLSISEDRQKNFSREYSKLLGGEIDV